MIKGKTKSGIEFTINEKVGEDMRVVMLIAEMQKASKEDSTAFETFEKLNDLLELIFGNGKMSFMNAVASTHDGVCDTKSMIAELTEIFDKVKAKNY